MWGSPASDVQRPGGGHEPHSPQRWNPPDWSHRWGKQTESWIIRHEALEEVEHLIVRHIGTAVFGLSHYLTTKSVGCRESNVSRILYFALQCKKIKTKHCILVKQVRNSNATKVCRTSSENRWWSASVAFTGGWQISCVRHLVSVL